MYLLLGNMILLESGTTETGDGQEGRERTLCVFCSGFGGLTG